MCGADHTLGAGRYWARNEHSFTWLYVGQRIIAINGNTSAVIVEEQQRGTVLCQTGIGPRAQQPQRTMTAAGVDSTHAWYYPSGMR